MLIAVLILVALALVVVVVLLRQGFVSPADWAKDHDAADRSEADLKSMTPDGLEPPPPSTDEPQPPAKPQS
jgi:hypothetical protein